MSSLSHHFVIPRMSEKAYAASQSATYVFEVPRSLSKADIAKSVAEIYSVTVTGVRVINSKGKPVTGRSNRRQRGVKSHRTDFKKAYVSVAEGQSIKIFAEETK